MGNYSYEVKNLSPIFELGQITSDPENIQIRYDCEITVTDETGKAITVKGILSDCVFSEEQLPYREECND